jgi:hypothetical protein
VHVSYKYFTLVCILLGEVDLQVSVFETKGVFGLAFGFGFYPLKAKSQTKGLDLGSSFF